MKQEIFTEETSPQDFESEIFWTVSDVADYLKFKPSTIYQWVSTRFIPFTRFGRKAIRFRKSDIYRWAKRFAVKPEPKEEKIEKRIKKEIEEKLPQDISQIVKKCIAEVKGEDYTSSQEKPEKVKGLGKEGSYGII